MSSIRLAQAPGVQGLSGQVQEQHATLTGHMFNKRAVHCLCRLSCHGACEEDKIRTSASSFSSFVDRIGSNSLAKCAALDSKSRWFGLRAKEAVALKVEDINVQGDVPKISVTGEVRGAKNLLEMCTSGSNTLAG